MNLKQYIPISTKLLIKKLLDFFKTYFIRKNLEKLGRFYKTDKIGNHFYLPHYQQHFEKFRLKKINLFEIGVGGYNDPNKGGNSLRMWKRYFRNGKVFSLDIYDKSKLEEKRIKIFCGSQVDRDLMMKIADEIGKIDIIIDDGSHFNQHVIETFKILFPRLKDGGIYVIEDIQSSYWTELGGDMDKNNPLTIMNFFKSLTDGLNNKEFIYPGYIPNYFDMKIISIHFYHNLIFVYKGDNNENSNVVENNERLLINL